MGEEKEAEALGEQLLIVTSACAYLCCPAVCFFGELMEESKVIEPVFEKLAEILTPKELVKMAQLFLVRTLE